MEREGTPREQTKGEFWPKKGAKTGTDQRQRDSAIPLNSLCFLFKTVQTFPELECGITNKAIHNLSSYPLTYYDSKLLGLGLNIIPLKQNISSKNIKFSLANSALDGIFEIRTESHPHFGFPIRIGIPHRLTPLLRKSLRPLKSRSSNLSKLLVLREQNSHLTYLLHLRSSCRIQTSSS